MWDTIRRLAHDGVTIFLTTQMLDEADALADRVAVLDAGRIVAQGTPAELKAQVPGSHVELVFADPAQVDAAARVLRTTARDDDALTLQVAGDGGVGALHALLHQLDEASIEVRTLSVHTPDLDDVFFALTGHAAADKGATDPGATSAAACAKPSATR